MVRRGRRDPLRGLQVARRVDVQTAAVLREQHTAKSASLIETLHGGGVGRSIFSSTCAVCGTPERVPVGEDAPVHPESPYGESKPMTERVLGWYDRCLGPRSVSLRHFNAPERGPTGRSGRTGPSRSTDPVPHEDGTRAGGPLDTFGTAYPTPGTGRPSVTACTSSTWPTRT